MKLKFKNKNINKGFPQVEKPYIYEDEKYLNWRRKLICIGLPLIVLALAILAYIDPSMDFTIFFLSVSISIFCYLLFVSMIKKGSKVFWLIVAYVTAIYSLTLFEFSTFLRGIPYIEEITLFLGLPLLVVHPLCFVYNLYYQWRESKRSGIKKCPEKLMQRNIQLKPKSRFKKENSSSKKTWKLFSRNKSKV